MTSPTPQARPTVVLPGNYDGVHAGHRALLARGREMADALGASVSALFFDPHPASVLRPGAAPASLTTVTRRSELLRGCGADHVVVRKFDAAFAALSPEAFVNDVLAAELGACGVVVGPDFRFGQGRKGDFAALTTLGRAAGMEAVAVEPVLHDGERVSSSGIRAALEKGRVSLATRMLLRVHDIEGMVVKGDQRGRTLGFPTANLQVDGSLMPADGIYAVVARCLDRPDRPLWHGAASLGVRPTMNAGRSVEVHLLDVNEDLYDRPLRMGFVAHLRKEEKFDSLDALVVQMHADVKAARSILATTPEEVLSWV